MTKDEIIQLARDSGFLNDTFNPTLEAAIVRLALACYEAGKAEFAKGAKVTIPPHAMEQEFQLHYRKGYEAGRTAEKQECKRVCELEINRLSAIGEHRAALAVGICAATIDDRGKP